MEDNYQDWIERYLNRELNKQESARFEQTLEEDPELRKQFEYYKLGLNALKQERYLELRKHFQELDRNENRDKFFLYILGAMLLICFCVFIINSYQKSGSRYSIPSIPSNSDSASTQIKIIEKNRDTLNSEMVIPHKDTQSVKPKPKNEKPLAVSKPDQHDLALHIEPYRGEELNIKVKALGELSPYDQFISLYWASKYNEALNAYDKLNESLKQNSNVLFIKANALLTQKKFKEAKALFSIVKSDPKSRYANIATDYYQRIAVLLQVREK